MVYPYSFHGLRLANGEGLREYDAAPQVYPDPLLFLHPFQNRVPPYLVVFPSGIDLFVGLDEVFIPGRSGR
jgi:hypothetical protein